MYAGKVEAWGAWGWLIAPGLLLGCDANPVYFTPVEAPLGARSVVLASSDDTPQLIDVLAEATSDDPLDVLISREAALLQLFHYRQELSELSLTPGRLAAGARCQRSCELSEPIGLASLRWTDAGFEPSEPSSAEQEPVFEFLLPDRSEWCRPQCRKWSSQVATLRTRELIVGVLPTPDQRVWILLANGETRLVTATGVVSNGCTLALERSSIAVAQDGRARFWIASDYDLSLRAIDARRLDEQGPCSIVHEAPTPALYYGSALAAAADDDPSIELFGMTAERALIRYDGSTWTTVGHFETAPEPEFAEDSVVGVLWLGRGKAMGFHASQEIVVVDGDESRSLQVPRHGGSGRIVAGQHAGDGVVVLSVEGAGLLRAAPPYSSWSYETPVPVFTVWSFDHAGEFVVTATKGSLTLRTRDGGVCDAVPFPNPGVTPELPSIGDARTFLMPRFTAIRTGAGEQDEQQVLIARVLEPCE